MALRPAAGALALALLAGFVVAQTEASVSTTSSAATTTMTTSDTATASGAAAQAEAADETAPAVPNSMLYIMSYDADVYADTEAFCNDWDSSCIDYLSTFSDVHQVVCDVTATGPQVHVYCGGNTVYQPNSYFDYTQNVNRFVSASLIDGPEEYGEAVGENSSSSTTASSSTSTTSSGTSSQTAASSAGSTTSSSQSAAPTSVPPASSTSDSDSSALEADAPSTSATSSSSAAKVTSQVQERTTSTSSSASATTTATISQTSISDSLSSAAHAAIQAAELARRRALAHLRRNVALAEKRARELVQRKEVELRRLREERAALLRRVRAATQRKAAAAAASHGQKTGEHSVEGVARRVKKVIKHKKGDDLLLGPGYTLDQKLEAAFGNVALSGHREEGALSAQESSLLHDAQWTRSTR